MSLRLRGFLVREGQAETRTADVQGAWLPLGLQGDGDAGGATPAQSLHASSQPPTRYSSIIPVPSPSFTILRECSEWQAGDGGPRQCREWQAGDGVLGRVWLQTRSRVCVEADRSHREALESVPGSPGCVPKPSNYSVTQSTNNLWRDLATPDNKEDKKAFVSFQLPKPANFKFFFEMFIFHPLKSQV